MKSMRKNKRNKNRKAWIVLLTVMMIFSISFSPATFAFAGAAGTAPAASKNEPSVPKSEKTETKKKATEAAEPRKTENSAESAEHVKKQPSNQDGDKKIGKTAKSIKNSGTTKTGKVDIAPESNVAGQKEAKEARDEGKRKPEENQKENRQVIIRAVDQNGKPLEKQVVQMERSLDARTWSFLEPDSEEAGGTRYTLAVKEKRENIFYTYRFTIMAKGYTPYEGEKFNFDRWNRYFNPADGADPAIVTVRMYTTDYTLTAAKNKAIQSLIHYKNKDDYRDAEKEKLQSEIDLGIEKINAATVVSSVEYSLKTAKERIDRIKTKRQYENEEARGRIFFKSDDGKTIVRPNKYGVINLTGVDSGTFYISRADGTVYPSNDYEAEWKCTWQYIEPDHGHIAWNVIIGSSGQYRGKFVGTYDAHVTLRDTGQKVDFKVRITDGHIDKLRAIIDGKDVSGATIDVMGSEKKQARIEGRLYGTDRWIPLPAHSLKYSPGGSTSVSHVTSQFRTWGTSGSMTYSLVSKPHIRVTVKIRASIVHPERIDVIVPEEGYVGDWDGAFDQYVGIRPGSYQVKVYPENTSNPSVKWTDLTPDIAVFQEKHAAGIVPRKAGIAKFRVTSVDRPSISKIVSVKFKYLRPLKTAVSDKSVYYARVGDGPISINIITNGEPKSQKGATEQRFHWYYSTGGVASVRDSVRFSPASVTIPYWCEHHISILGEGVVYVTGKPYDTTGGCKPVHFKVIVSSIVDRDREAVERVERMINAIGEVTLEKKNQIYDARAAFNDLTRIQKGMVDEGIYAKLVAAELRLRELLRQGGDNPQGEPGGENPGGPGGDKPGGTPGGSTTPKSSAKVGKTDNGKVPKPSIKPAGASVRSSSKPSSSAAKRMLREVEIQKNIGKKIKIVKTLSPILSLILILILAGTFGSGALRRYVLYRREQD